MDSCCLCKYCRRLLNLYGSKIDNENGEIKCANCEFPAVDMEMVTKLEYREALKIYKAL